MRVVGVVKVLMSCECHVTICTSIAVEGQGDCSHLVHIQGMGKGNLKFMTLSHSYSLLRIFSFPNQLDPGGACLIVEQ